MDLVGITPEGMKRAAAALRAGDIIAYPTETVYGLGADPFNPDALQKLAALKGRSSKNPFLLIVSSMEQLGAVASQVSERALRYAEAFWPGPLSMVLPGNSNLPAMLLGADGRVCVRLSASEEATWLCETFGGAVVSTSANAAGGTPALAPNQIESMGIGLCLDGGTLPPSAPSTVFDPESGEVLREGVIAAADLQAVEVG